MSPERRRRAVVVLQQRFGVSQRRACRVVGQHRSTQRRPAGPAGEAEQSVRARLRQVAKPRWGWRKAYWVLRAEGHLVNHERVVGPGHRVLLQTRTQPLSQTEVNNRGTDWLDHKTGSGHVYCRSTFGQFELSGETGRTL